MDARSQKWMLEEVRDGTDDAGDLRVILAMTQAKDSHRTRAMFLHNDQQRVVLGQ